MGSTRWFRGVLVGISVAAAFASCAQGEQVVTGGGGQGGGVISSSHGSGGGMPDSGPMIGIGSPCPKGACTEGTCTLVGKDAYCTVACPPDCPSGTYCSIIGGNPICVPDLGQQCDKCST